MQFTFVNHTLDVGRCSAPARRFPCNRKFSAWIYLVRNSDRVVSKADLIALVWDGRAVDIHQPDQRRADHY
jgi:hypothetical protein